MMQPEQQVMLNQVWAELIIEELVRNGVKHVCIAPGSRSTPLTLAASEHQHLSIHTHFDERGLGFLALGIAKASNEAVAVIVTSGTAVANLLPSVAESGLTKEKLILLTADRPVELINCGANQAINQQGIFSSHVCHSLQLPSPTINVPAQWLLSRLDQACFIQQEQGGAIHINCPFPEPFYGKKDNTFVREYLAPIQEWKEAFSAYIQQPRYSSIMTVSPQWMKTAQKKGIVIIGKVSLEEAQAAAELAKELGWPVLADPQSGYYSEWAHYDLWLQNSDCIELLSDVECVLQFGARLVSKRLAAWLDNYHNDYYLIDPHSELLDVSSHSHVRYRANIRPWCQAHIDSLVERDCYFDHAPSLLWSESLKVASLNALALARSMACNSETLSELSFALTIGQKVESCDWFIGNSLIVRLLDMVGELNQQHTYTNRGASGIDGLVATAVGVQKANQKPLLALVGDTSLLYDLNSLALLKQATAPVVLVVMNNDGGGIFDLLPVDEKKKDDYYRMPHKLEFSHAAAMFGLAYHRPETLSCAISMINEGLESGVHLVEINTPAGQAGEELTRLFQTIQHATLF
ncbi:2-succinyl-5-enolpyruvyl-6-hydroxy-3-cyclohexene-1-carboxylic-acid synthase [Aliivibrio finisterrensis]|uniref:2-succinyl-5-enolpyruvyl-6-hydroxy-3-cyclohexene-1-carboxylate synthase n=1 Tax=Aliivibrio finisterrensis TaxID=511998 RepID=A0A4Q5KQ00_9GAMM|nr:MULTISPECIES: 2-succinyl-5-enolpyruvyl-6-hydroxy-3-cyclohexene-1-carboxylic-acid synthase [Aliivibrio]MDD9174753.1 2-succinyl-5-enolpyruvyl-6-hydroxy-3-cyclohexene-1-carboxylic-acid synthase [Aliivibrio sp. S3TY1]MDD9191832.1 2-succinyl-5-enolpyruvyl-6-hydroxy-3-cyclohexene-1-carboxylic-acid synthase [Aliivibrio sp. S2TY2]RYU48703.1 2-succinyl-5-enolpyruvyl-6-hydroxy-3-cyclohexene-1-carboxylic-acid synthase [Aliivibrio finisterrensis]